MEEKELVLIDKVIDWAEKENPAKVGDWLYFCREYLILWGWNKKAVDDFVSWGQHGYNNNFLQFTTSHSNFYGEVRYASDRMSIDRLFRCHVAYWTLPKDYSDKE